MATLAGQRTQFTWALNQYNQAEDEERKPISQNGWQNILPPHQPTVLRWNRSRKANSTQSAEVAQYLPTVSSDADPGISEEEAINAVAAAVDTSNVLKLGEGPKVVYAYGYGCAPDRLKSD